MLPPRPVILVALVALWRLARRSGIFDGAKFDSRPDAVILGLLRPVLPSLTSTNGRNRRVQIVVSSVLAWKDRSSATFAPDGSCNVRRQRCSEYVAFTTSDRLARSSKTPPVNEVSL